MPSETQFDLFGGPPLVRQAKTKYDDGPKATQLTLFSGLDCEPGQMNFFADTGVPADLVAAEDGSSEKSTADE